MSKVCLGEIYIYIHKGLRLEFESTFMTASCGKEFGVVSLTGKLHKFGPSGH